MTHENFNAKIAATLNQMLFFKKKNILEFEGIILYPSEIHLLLMVSRNQPSNATKMAERLGITKGAVSQTLTRLEKKGILIKNKDPYNKNELTVILTPLGITAHDKYQELQTLLFKRLDRHFSAFSENEREIINQFLTGLNKILGNVEKSE